MTLELNHLFLALFYHHIDIILLLTSIPVILMCLCSQHVCQIFLISCHENSSTRGLTALGRTFAETQNSNGPHNCLELQLQGYDILLSLRVSGIHLYTCRKSTQAHQIKINLLKKELQGQITFWVF